MGGYGLPFSFMTKTAQDLATKALRELGVIDSTETPSAADADTVKEVYDSLYDELQEWDVAYWPKEEIPLVVFTNLAKLLASDCAMEFSAEYSQGDAMARLQAHASKSYNGETVKADYF